MNEQTNRPTDRYKQSDRLTDVEIKRNMPSHVFCSVLAGHRQQVLSLQESRSHTENQHGPQGRDNENGN